MHGNVWEWCADGYDRRYYANSPTDDPSGPRTATNRVIRGGCWFFDAGDCRAAFRRVFMPRLRRFNLGFRVAAVPPGNAVAAMAKAVVAQRECSQKLGLPVEITSSIGMKLRLIPAGEFMMGLQELGPQHKVRITKPFYLGVTEVTQEQYEKVMGKNPSKFKGAGNPVEQVSWDDAVEFCKRLSAEEGKTYRLATEAEWEYACRAGTTTRYSFGDDPASLGEYAWYSDNSDGKTHPVGEKKPNAWGLHDMHGSVGEWCADWHEPWRPETGSLQVYRGGDWFYGPRRCRSSSRTMCKPGYRGIYLGFRVAVGEKPDPDALEEAKAAMEEGVAGQKAALKAAIEEAVAAQKDCGRRLGLPVEITNSIGMKLKLIPAGEFMMGSGKSPQELVRLLGMREDATKWFTDEQPQHRVRITKPFYLGVYEVTQAEYEKVMGEDPSNFKGPSHPVEQVSWNDAVEFCKRLSAKEGKTYRLPTEAEWEYACRAGSTTLYSFGDDPASLGQHAWHRGNSHGVARRAGQKKPNTWGLHDMHGNVWEWCADWWAEDYYAVSPTDDPPGPETTTYRVIRGGCWWDGARLCRAACRSRYVPRDRIVCLGFRVAAVPPSKSSQGQANKQAEP